ncbi:hypothetical protein [Methylophaga sp.]|uniref:hypothetical protein n=1 Tax=Methylophaga sp. TaxID=2024840 RepID=UPI003A93567C
MKLKLRRLKEKDGPIFFSTADPADSMTYRIVAGASLQREEEVRKFSLGFFVEDRTLYISSLFNFAILLFSSVVKNRFMGLNSVRLTYKSINIGKFAVSMALRHPDAYLNKVTYYERLLKFIFICVRNVDNFLCIRSSVRACYVNEPYYTNGVYCELAAKFNIPLYHNTYPFRLSRFMFSNNEPSVKAFVVKPDEAADFDKEHIGRQILNDIVTSTETIEYMSTVPFEAREVADFEADAIVYAHSFTDAQQSFGGDAAFLNMYEWLLFTLKKLGDRKVILKAHPAFFREGYKAEVIKWDRAVFERLVSRISGAPNLTVIDWPMRNVDLLKCVKKECVLISHHGNALVEGAGLGFRCISSLSSPWRRYNLFNTWQTQDEYAQLLKDFRSLKVTDLEILYGYVFDLYKGESSFFHQDSWRQIVARELGVPPVSISQNKDILQNLSNTEVMRLISIISKGIREVYLG